MERNWCHQILLPAVTYPQDLDIHSSNLPLSCWPLDPLRTSISISSTESGILLSRELSCILEEPDPSPSANCNVVSAEFSADLLLSCIDREDISVIVSSSTDFLYLIRAIVASGLIACKDKNNQELVLKLSMKCSY